MIRLNRLRALFDILVVKYGAESIRHHDVMQSGVSWTSPRLIEVEKAV